MLRASQTVTLKPPKKTLIKLNKTKSPEEPQHVNNTISSYKLKYLHDVTQPMGMSNKQRKHNPPAGIILFEGPKFNILGPQRAIMKHDHLLHFVQMQKCWTYKDLQ